MSGVTRENEAPRLVVPNTALIFHLRTFRCEIFQNLHLKLFMFYLDVIRIYLLSWKHIECTVIVSPIENTSTTVVPDGKYQLLFQIETEIFLYARAILVLSKMPKSSQVYHQ